MAQFARPDSDLSTGGWTAQGQTNLYECVDEETANDDTDYILAEGDTTCELGLSDVNDPNSSTGHIIRFRIKSTGSKAPERCQVDLYQGTTLIASTGTQSSRDAYSSFEYTLTAIEADSIGNYADLRFKIISSNLDTGETMRCTWVELEVPDAGLQSGWNKLAYASEPPTPNAWNQLKDAGGTGWVQIKYEGE